MTSRLTERQTSYVWNSFFSSPFSSQVRVRQGSILSLVLSAFYLALILKTFQNKIKNIKEKIPTDLLSFVDDGLIVLQEKSCDTANAYLLCSYNIISKLLKNAGLTIKHEKSDIFHFSHQQNFNSPSLNLFSIGGPVLNPKPIWQYLRFFFNRKLIFRQHCHYYATKSLSIVKAMKMLGNST